MCYISDIRPRQHCSPSIHKELPLFQVVISEMRVRGSFNEKRKVQVLNISNIEQALLRFSITQRQS